MKVFLCKDTDGGRETIVACDSIRIAIDLFEKAYGGVPEVVRDLTADHEEVIIQGVIEPEYKEEMNSYKIHTKNKEINIKVQKHALRLGYRWWKKGEKIYNETAPFLYFYPDGRISWGTSLDMFKQPKYHQVGEFKEISAEEFLKL